MLLDLFRQKGKFLVIEIEPQGARGIFFDVDDDRRVSIKKILKKPAREFAKAIERQQAAKKKIPRAQGITPGGRRVIAAVHPELATTIPISLKLDRDEANIKTKITLPELENLIAQALAKIFNGCRKEAEMRLKVNELDAVLVGAAAIDFKVDGKSVGNPVGISGRAISLLLELTFTNRELFEAFKPLFNNEDEEPFYFAEAPQAHMRALSKVRAMPLNFVKADRDRTSLYIFTEAKDGYPVLYRETLNWNFSSLIKALADAFGTSDTAGDGLYHLYHRGEMSAAALRTLKGIMEPALEGLIKELVHAKVSGPVYIDSPHPLPFALPYKSGKLIVGEHPAREIIDGLGFTLSEEGKHGVHIKGEGWFGILLPILHFTEAYFDKNDSAINRKLKRRLHWLAEP